MKQKAEIIQDLEDQILFRFKKIKALQSEVNTLQTTVSSLRALDEDGLPLVKATTQENNLVNFPGYPLDGTLIEKYRYLEDKTLRVWAQKDMQLLIEQVEGKRSAAKTLKSARQKTHYYLKTRELIRLKYSNKNNYSFFTTRSEWIERENNEGKITFHLLPQHEPEPTLLEGLSEDGRKSNNISWAGIN